MLLPSPGIRPQEDLYIDGSTKLYNGTSSSAGRGSPGGGKNDLLGPGSKAGETHRHDEGYALGEAAPPKIQPRIRQLQDEAVCKKTTAVLQLPKVWPHGQDVLEGRPDVPLLCRQPPLKPMQRGHGVLIFNQSMKALSDHHINRCLICM